MILDVRPEQEVDKINNQVNGESARKLLTLSNNINENNKEKEIDLEY